MRPGSRPPILLALLAQGLAFAGTLLLARSGWIPLPPLAWLAVEATSAALLGHLLRLPPWWIPLNLALPWVVHLALGAAIPGSAYLITFLALGLVFGGGLLTRVPLYHANRAAWAALAQAIPPGARRVVDLGCGLGGPLAHLARARPELRLVGVEASPMTWLLAWLRCRHLPQVEIRLGSLWKVPLADFDAAYAFLSPEPMAALWEKVRREMRPGTVFLSHTFAVPGRPEDWNRPLPGREGACLRGFRL